MTVDTDLMVPLKKRALELLPKKVEMVSLKDIIVKQLSSEQLLAIQHQDTFPSGRYCIYCQQSHVVASELYHSVSGNLPEEEEAINRKQGSGLSSVPREADAGKARMVTYFTWTCTCGETSAGTIKESRSEEGAKEGWRSHRLESCNAAEAHMEIGTREVLQIDTR